MRIQVSCRSWEPGLQKLTASDLARVLHSGAVSCKFFEVLTVSCKHLDAEVSSSAKDVGISAFVR